MTWYTLCVIIVASVRSLELYKGVLDPWVAKEAPKCRNNDICPGQATYTWNSYFQKLLDMNVRNFLFGGYAINGSDVIKYYPYISASWNESEFASLRRLTKDRNGKILAVVPLRFIHNFDEAIFMNNVRDFIKKYPVDGFVVRPYLGWGSAYKSSVVFKALKKLGLTVGFESDYINWAELTRRRVLEETDINIVDLRPSQIDRFMTDEFAEEAIGNTVRAGARLDSIILRVPLIAIQSHSSAAGYSEMIYDFGADPKGNGSVKTDQTTNDGFYFFSQTRAVDKITVARNSNLHGIALEGGDELSQDLLPWDESSLLYALASNMDDPYAPILH